MAKEPELFELGGRYSFAWDDGSGGSEYEYGAVLSQVGAVVSVQLDSGKKTVINTSSAPFIRADIQRG